MSLVRPRFRDGASILADYVFEIGHHEEDPDGRARTVTRTAPTSGVGFVRQQGADSPRVLSLKGSILTQDQYDKMSDYYDACRIRTVFYRDYTDVESAVLITRFESQRIPVARNPRDPSIMHKWTYTLVMEVIN